MRRCNQIFALGGNKASIPIEVTYFVYGLSAALLSFCIVKTNINFAFYFFVSTRSASQDYLQKRREKMEEDG